MAFYGLSSFNTSYLKIFGGKCGSCRVELNKNDSFVTEDGNVSQVTGNQEKDTVCRQLSYTSAGVTATTVYVSLILKQHTLSIRLFRRGLN